MARKLERVHTHTHTHTHTQGNLINKKRISTKMLLLVINKKDR